MCVSRRMIAVAILGGGVASCAPPVVFTVNSTVPAPDVHRCVTEQVIDHGFRVVESRREDGILKAERLGTFLGFPDPDELHVIEIVIFRRADGSTAVQYTAGRVAFDEGPALQGPDDDVAHIADRIADLCSE